MNANRLIRLLLIIIIITCGGIIIIILRQPFPPPIGPDPICPQCGLVKGLLGVQLFASIISLFSLPKLRNEIRDELKAENNNFNN